ncbi:MAG: amidohydrolase [Christensenellales bacterium]|jgi:5-methylthioadenosine/S-adenosylhomocysteine deaminase
MLFKNADVLIYDGEKICREHAWVYIRGNRIAYVGPEENVPQEAFLQPESVDASGMLLMPGFVNAHTHVPMSLFRGHADDLPLSSWLNDRIWPMEAKLTREHVYYGSLLSMAEMLKNGVTAIADMYFSPEQIIKAVRESGMRASVSRAMVDADGGGEQRLTEALALMDEYDGAEGGRIKITLAPHAEYTCSEGYLEKIAKEAQQRGCFIHIHASESFQERQDCMGRHGVSPIQFLDRVGILGEKTMAAHCVHLDEADIETLAARKTSVLHCPGSNLKLGSGIAPAAALLERGVNVALGTDGAASNNRQDVWGEMRLAALLQKGAAQDAALVDASTAVRMATINGARALGFEDCGSIVQGALADLVLVALDAPHYAPDAPLPSMLVYGGCGADVRLTMVDGKVVYKDGEFTGMDMDEVLENCRKAMLELC